MACDPLALADQYIQRIRDIQDEANRQFASIPGSLGGLLQCLAFGTADRASGALDPEGLSAYDLDSLRRRVDSIFDAVEKGVDQVGDQISGNADSEVADFAAATSGLWLATDPANTFYGLASARATGAIDDANSLAPLIESARSAVAEVRVAVSDLSGPQGQALLETARLYEDEICPNVDVIRQGLMDLSGEVGRTGDLDRSRCGVPALEAQLRALMARIPGDGLEPLTTAIEALRRMRESVDELEVIRERLEAVEDDLPAFRDQMEAGGYAVQTEQRLPRALADQFAEICERIAELASRNRLAEMAALGPQLKEIAAVAITTLEQSPKWRLEQIDAHPASVPFEEFNRTLRGAKRAGSGSDKMDWIGDNFAASIIDLSDEFDGAVSDYEEYLTLLDQYGQVVSMGAGEFLGLTQELIDQLCVGALRILLYEIGYEALNNLFARGAFGDIPQATYELMTTTGRLISCIGDVLNGTLSRLPLSGEQRFALERATDALRVLEDADQQVAEVARELDGWLREPPLTNISKIAAALEVDIKGGMRDLGIAIPGLPGTKPSSDGFIELLDDSLELPEGIVKDTAGFLKAEVGVPIPEGYLRQPNGYLITSTLGL